MNRTMLNGTVLLKRLDVDDTKFAGTDLIKPDVSQVRSNRAEVIAVGTDETEIHIGDVVVFTRYGGTEVDIDGSEHVIVNRKQIYWCEKQHRLARVAS